jgi:cobalamin biosynthetic protein CobC
MDDRYAHAANLAGIHASVTEALGPPSRIEHGGNLADAIQRYGIPRHRWLDLSTGINPIGYPVPAPSPDTWRRLPEEDDGLAALAARHYGAALALPVAGSQAAIRALPQLLERGTVGIANLSYGEYGLAFERAGHQVIEFDDDLAYALGPSLPIDLLHLVVVNPNNPTGTRISPTLLLEWHRQLARRGGTLLVDEAFIETEPGDSVAAASAAPGLIVLRSIGKFYGLAGARVGFVLAEAGLLEQLDAWLGPWSVSGPARHAAMAALADDAWQVAAIGRLKRGAARLQTMLMDAALLSPEPADIDTPLFTWVPHNAARQLHDALARHAIWTRLFDHPIQPGVRIGLPGVPADWQRLAAALQQLHGPDTTTGYL